MPILHKNITAEADIHNPKWFPSANNGDVSWKNEKGELEATDELVLPAALDFVDASVAPPTTNSGDIYVLASGGSVEAGWGAVALDDWVRYDGTDWNSITPQKSTLCYDEDTDELYAYDGVDWVQVGGVTGGNGIYGVSDVVPSSIVATLTDTLTFDGGTVKVQGANTLSGSTALGVYDGDTTPSLLWDWRNDGKLLYKNGNPLVIGNVLGTILNNNALIALGAGNTVNGVASRVIGNNNNVTGAGNIIVGGSISSTQDFTVALGTWLSSTAVGASIIGYGVSGSSVLVNNTANSIAFGWSQTTPQHLLTSTGAIFKGTISTDGNTGLTNTYTFGGGSTGDIASMTFTNGILTGVTTVP